MSDIVPPKRRLRLVLDLGADDLEGVYRALRCIADDLSIEGLERRIVESGGYSSGYHLDLSVTDETMTGDRFREELSAWSKARRDARAAPKSEPVGAPEA